MCIKPHQTAFDHFEFMMVQRQSSLLLATCSLFLLSLGLYAVNASSSANEAAGKRAPVANYRSKDEQARQLTLQVASQLGLRPPLLVPPWVTKLSRKMDRCTLSVMCALDDCFSRRRQRRLVNSKLSLQVLIWKARATSCCNDPTSPAYDEGLAYDMLPPLLRLVVVLNRCWPKLMVHTIMEIRSVYLDKCIKQIVELVRAQNKDSSSSSSSPGKTTKIRLISMGAGYDVRSMKLRLQNLVDEAVELDLPEVVQAKTRLLQSKRLLQRRRRLVTGDWLPKLYAVNLNDVQGTRETLQQIIMQQSAATSRMNKSDDTGDDDDDDDVEWHNIFLFEAVLMYLDHPKELLQACRQALDSASVSDANNQGYPQQQRRKQTGSLCFADDLAGMVPKYELDIATRELAQCGWKLIDWVPRGGRSRHMGWAEAML